MRWGRSTSTATISFLGAVDVHTDNLERQVLPRSLARWPSRSARWWRTTHAMRRRRHHHHSGRALSGRSGGSTPGRIPKRFRDGKIADLDALAPTGLLKSQHYLHLRCEIPALDMLSCFDAVAEHPLVRLISLMDHSPGVGQYADLEFYRNLRRRGVASTRPRSIARIGELQEQRTRVREPNRRTLLDRVRGRGIALKPATTIARLTKSLRKRARRHSHQ